MALGLLANDQGIQGTAVQGGPHRHGAHQGIGAQGETGHGHGLRLQLLQQQSPEQGQADAAEAHRFAVHVVITGAAGGEGELTTAIGPFRQQGQQPGAQFGGAARQGRGQRCVRHGRMEGALDSLRP